MISTGVVHNFTELKNETIDDIKRNCFAHFGYEVIEKMFEGKDKITYDTLSNYRLFDELGRKITYNSKNIEYTEVFTDLKDNFLKFIDVFPREMPSNVEKGMENVFIHDDVISQLKEFVMIKDNESEKSYQVASILFGRGEFPYMHVYITRIGNRKYYFYTLGR